MIDKLKDLRKRCLELSHFGNDGNLQSTFSAIDIIYALYNGAMSKDDDFVLSKGQASLGLYVVLEDLGLINTDELNDFCKFGSKFGMQIDITKFNDNIFSASTGSLGHGLPIAVGIALANKIQGINNRVFCLCGDGEFNEGTMWESLLQIKHNNLTNLTVIVDFNASVFDMVHFGSFQDKFVSFGLDIGYIDIRYFNNMTDILGNYFNIPTIILAHTYRGWGSNTLMEDNSWFHRSPTFIELDQLKKEVDDF